MTTVGIEGIRVGHWTGEATGCTVIVLPAESTVSGEVRGGAPATREFALLAPERMITAVDAVVLSGGSAFGLAAADGVMEGLLADDRGHETAGGRVPIVVGMSLYDLTRGDVRPGPTEGRAAYDAAASTFEGGRVGAGRGATIDKWRGADHAKPGGLGCHIERRGDLIVAALVAVNACGGLSSRGDADLLAEWPQPSFEEENTTLGVILTNARLTKVECHRVAQGGHDGLARALFPPHLSVDGDAIVTAATGDVEAPVDYVRTLGIVAVEGAIAAAAENAERLTPDS